MLEQEGLAPMTMNSKESCHTCKCWCTKGAGTYAAEVPGPLGHLGRATPEPTIEGLAAIRRRIRLMGISSRRIGTSLEYSLARVVHVGRTVS
jgi:hypothetical protein